MMEKFELQTVIIAWFGRFYMHHLICIYISLARDLLVYKVVSVCQAWADQSRMRERCPGKC